MLLGNEILPTSNFVVAVLSGGGGALLLKLADRMFDSLRQRGQLAGNIGELTLREGTDILRTEITTLRVELEKRTTDLDTCRQRYYRLLARSGRLDLLGDPELSDPTGPPKT
jgi:hypothetical protein